MRQARRVVVTGGGGFIGSHLVDRLLRAGIQVVVLDDFSGASRSSVPAGAEVWEIDIATPETVRAIIDAHPDSVVHCAAQTSVPASFADPVRDAWSNIVGSLRVIEGCSRSGVTGFVYVTTGGALYSRPMVAPWDELAAITPISPYGISKSVIESYLNVMAPASHVTVLRLANVYGPRQGVFGEAGVVATFIERMRDDLPVTIHDDGEQTRDLLYVADAVDAIEAGLNGRLSGTFNIGSGVGTTINTLFKELADLTGYDRPPEFGEKRVGDVRHSALDSTLAGRLLGWHARTSLRSGLAETIGSWASSATKS